MRMGTGVLTSDHRALCWEVPDVIFSGWRAARLAKRRRVFTRLRMLSKSRRRDLGQRCLKGVLFFGVADLCGNKIVVVVVASSRIV